jgi:hypothetical protein
MRRFLIGLLAGCCASQGLAEVTAIEVAEQRPWIPGRNFAAGEYEIVHGIARYEIDPMAASSADITDVRLMPPNARGKVEFSGPFLLLRPADPRRANGTTIVEIANRGITQMQGTLVETDSLALLKNATRDVSRSALFDRGYSFAWAGWQGDLKPDEFGLTVPTVPLSGPVRSSTYLGYRRASLDGGPLEQHGACAADIHDPAAVLRVHRSFDDPGTIVPRSEWRFARKEKDGTVVDDSCAFLLSKPLSKAGLVSIVFQGQAPKGISLGQVAIRDFTSHLKYRDIASPLNMRAGDSRRVLAFGYSQSSRFLRDFLYRGFNADVRRRPVFDGVLEAAAGAGRGSFNHRYAVPGQAGNSVGSVLRAVDLYPFADLPSPDIDGRGKEGLLDRARRDKVQPRVFHILSSSEYWARAGSLIHTTADGRKALSEADGTRIYAFAGTPHGPRRHGLFLEKDGKADLPYNDNSDMFTALPALLVALDGWIAENKAPPPSRFPKLGESLVRPADLRFPKVPNVQVPLGPPPVWQLKLGPLYRSQGILAEPPMIGPRYPLLVPQVDDDGNELGSWRGMIQSVPLGTYTAWNHQIVAMDSFGYLSGLQGAFIPFPATNAEREKTGDPRRSVSERYAGLDGYMKAASKAADEQIAAGFLLSEERDHALTTMRINWDRVLASRLHWPRTRE